MRIRVPNEVMGEELRVAVVPAVVKKWVAAGHAVEVERGAGLSAMFDDAGYQSAGAELVEVVSGWGGADVVMTIGVPSIERVRTMRAGSVLIGMLRPLDHPEFVRELASTGVTAMAMELVPRITRAQSMDALSSQANLAGYLAVILAAEKLERVFPMMMTAAGTLQPARVFVIGAGVAGLQAIATARRLGAVVSAYDVRPAVKEQVQSVGAKFIELPMDTSGAQDAGGYAREQSAEQQEKQRQLMARVISESDVVITTALIPGKPAPKLIPTEAVKRMARGSVIVDLAAERGGNCELTVPGETVVREGVTIIGARNLAAGVPTHASQVYAANLQKLLEAITDKSGAWKLDPADEITSAMTLTRDGVVVHANLKSILGLS